MGRTFNKNLFGGRLFTALHDYTQWGNRKRKKCEWIVKRERTEKKKNQWRLLNY